MNGQMCTALFSHQGPKPNGKKRMHGASEINREVLGIKPTDQSCHHEVWIHLLHASAWQVERDRTNSVTMEGQDWRPNAKKRPNPWDHLLLFISFNMQGSAPRRQVWWNAHQGLCAVSTC